MPYGTETEKTIGRVVDACTAHGSTSVIALAGAPGTGKSFIAQIASQRFTQEPTLVREIQFHPSYTYEEFVEGMRIDAKGAVEALPGVFTEWNERALDDPSRRYVLLIEELTRANVSAVLGELMTYIEHRQRPFLTMYSRRSLTVAKNLTLIATYNPTDRSAIDLDGALLRRLRIIDFKPSAEQLGEMLTDRLPPLVISALADLFRRCQEQFPDDYDALIPFGHGVFSEVKSEADLSDLWHQRLVKFLRRPIHGPHPLAEIIEANFPWKNSKYRVPEPIQPSTDQENPAAPAASNA